MEPPYHEMSPMRVLLKIQKSDPPGLDRPSKWGRQFNDFLRCCLVKDPNQRPRSEELLKVSETEKCETFVVTVILSQMALTFVKLFSCV